MRLYTSKYLVAFFLIAGWYMQARAQQGFVALGGETSGGSGSASFSVGQIAYQPVNSAGNLFIEGLQQPAMPEAGLPIVLLYFRAMAGSNQTVKLQWVTVSEKNTHYFTLERSRDAVQFSGFANIPARGNSSTRWVYDATDSTPYAGNSYYRLAATDYDGTTRYSPIVRLNLSDVLLACSVGPNPAKSYINIYTKGASAGTIRYSLSDMMGRRLLEGSVSGTITLLDLSRYPPADYFLQLRQNGKTVKTFRVTKQ